MVEVTGRAPAENRFTIAKGENKVVELAVGATLDQAAAPPVAKVPPPAAADADPGRTRRIAAYATSGVGAAMLVVGGVTGGLALSKKSTVNADCKNLVCTSTGQSAVTAGRTLGNVSTAGFVIGGAALATGIALYFTAPKKPAGESRAAGLPAGIAGGIDAGPQGVSATVKGVF
jgi:hypothetical protein